MIQTTTTISNKLGLHARASAKLTKLAGSFACEVWMSKGDTAHADFGALGGIAVQFV